jgi:asparagine synthase (glutamine-hydrolysing)
MRQVTAWSLVKRRPWIHIALRAAALLAPVPIQARLMKEAEPAPWITAAFGKSFRLSLRQLGPVDRFGFWLPSRQTCARTAVAMSRLMAQSDDSIAGRETHYPYLDQDLVGFVLSVPREQLIRPGQRRSLMRRALRSVVPDEILSRRTKGTIARRPLQAVATDWKELDKLLDSSLSAQCGYVNQWQFRDALLKAKQGDAPQLVRLLQTLSFEFWLQQLARRNLVRLPNRTSGPRETEHATAPTIEQPPQIEPA